MIVQAKAIILQARVDCVSCDEGGDGLLGTCVNGWRRWRYWCGRWRRWGAGRMVWRRHRRRPHHRAATTAKDGIAVVGYAVGATARALACDVANAEFIDLTGVVKTASVLLGASPRFCPREVGPEQGQPRPQRDLMGDSWTPTLRASRSSSQTALRTVQRIDDRHPGTPVNPRGNATGVSRVRHDPQSRR